MDLPDEPSRRSTTMSPSAEEVGAMFCHTLLRSPRGAAVLGVALSAVLTSVASAQSQDRRVVFIHGLFGNNPTWQATGNYLAWQHQIQPWYPNPGWDNRSETQGTNL